MRATTGEMIQDCQNVIARDFHIAMETKSFCDEIIRRFPEIRPRIFSGDESLPYMMLRHVVDWLVSVAEPKLASAVIERIARFDAWCAAQPSGNSATNDFWTMQVVGLREHLFEHDELLPLVARLYSREELVCNREYLVTWIGAERLDAAIRYVERTTAC